MTDVPTEATTEVSTEASTEAETEAPFVPAVGSPYQVKLVNSDQCLKVEEEKRLTFWTSTSI